MKNNPLSIAVLASFFLTALAFDAPAGTVNATQYMIPGHMFGTFGDHGGGFKVADLDLDGTSEIIMLDGSVLLVLDRRGEVLLSKTVEGLDTGWWFGRHKNLSTGNVLNGGMHHGGPWDDDPGDMPMDDPEWWETMPSFGSHMSGSQFEVANIDEDDNPEIIVRAADRFIVLDHNGDEEFTIAFPTAVVP